MDALPGDLLAAILQRVPTIYRARATTVCRRWAGVLNESRAWQQVDLRDLKTERCRPADDLQQYKDMVLEADRAAALQRWWRRHAHEPKSVPRAQPTRFLLHQEEGSAADRVFKTQLLGGLLGMLAVGPAPSKLQRLAIGRRHRDLAPLHSELLPLVSFCDGLRRLALWQLDPFTSDVLLADALRPLQQLRVLALAWCAPPDEDDDSWNGMEDEGYSLEPPDTQSAASPWRLWPPASS